MENAFDGLNQYFERGVLEQAKRYNYSEPNILILKNNLAYDFELKWKYPQICENIFSCSKQSDKREPLDFARDIVAGWVFEDYIMQMMRSEVFAVKLGGADKEREILPANKVTYRSDFVLKYQKKSYKLELMTNYTGYWSNCGRFHLRCDKYKDLVEEKCFLLGVCIVSNRFLLIDFDEAPKSKRIEHLVWKKPAQEIEICDSVLFYNLTSEEIVGQLQKHLDGRIKRKMS